MDRYFKYLSPDGARAVLRGGSLKWSRPSTFNDIFDMSASAQSAIDTRRVGDMALRLMWERVRGVSKVPPVNAMAHALEIGRPHFLAGGFKRFKKDMEGEIQSLLEGLPITLQDLDKQIEEHLRKTKVLCLSRDNDNNAMWGLYAKEHTGLALEFANIPGLDSPYRLARRMMYCDAPPPLLDGQEIAQLLAGGYSLAPSLADKRIYVKSNHWRFENEVRITTGDGRNPDAEFEIVPFDNRELVAVYFGVRSTDIVKELKGEILEKYPHATMWQAQKGEAFGIQFTPC